MIGWTVSNRMFARAVSDNFDARREQKVFHSEIVVDNEKGRKEGRKEGNEYLPKDTNR